MAPRPRGTFPTVSFCLLQPDAVALYANLAREQLLLDGGGGTVPVLMLWRGPQAVVMGKNQNPWRECDPQYLRENGIPLARRVSGGGAVYHDPGNLNFSWILPREGYVPAFCHDLACRALARLGLTAQVAPTGGLLVQGKKVSGSAYCYRRERVLHHGTLLLDADLGRLRAALSPPRVQVHTHAVRSVPAQVANLRDFLPELTREQLMCALVTEAHQVLGPVQDCDPDFGGLDAVTVQLSSPEWIWGQTPRFSARVRLRDQWLRLTVRQGRVEELTQNDVAVPPPKSVFCTDPWYAEMAELLGGRAEDCRRAFGAYGFCAIT